MVNASMPSFPFYSQWIRTLGCYLENYKHTDFSIEVTAILNDGAKISPFLKAFLLETHLFAGLAF